MLRFYGVCRMLSLVFSLTVLVPVYAVAESSVPEKASRELVWSQSDGLRHEVFTSSFLNNAWTEPVKITDNNANNLHPVIDIGENGSKWLFWSAIRPDGISIEYAVMEKKEWSEPIKMDFEQQSSITPSILIDGDGTVWLVWAGNDGNLDEIYYSRYVDNKWQKAKVLNVENNVPDIKPVIAYDDQGRIEVTWQGYRDGLYKRLVSVYTDGKWSAEKELADKETKLDEEEILQESDIKLPTFMSMDSQYFLKVL